MKKLPIGIDDFKRLIEDDYYFFDKSLLIDELLENKSIVTLLPRPRRFGKTLNMTMLKYFFDIENKEENRKLYTGLLIEKTNKMEEQGRFPIIYFTLKDIKFNNWEDSKKSLEDLIGRVYNEKRYVLEILEEDEKEIFNNILFGKKEGRYITSLLNLCKYLERYHKRKVILLIDEYDTPLISAQTNNYYEEAMGFFRNFLSSALKGNESLELAVMTGILRIAKESIFSGLNNLVVSTILDDKYNHFGLEEKEVEEATKLYNLDYEMNDIKKWYNGYRFGEKLVYNPWSIINFLSEKKLAPYWVNTSENIIIKDMLNKGNEDIIIDLEKIFSDQLMEKYIDDTVIFKDLDKVDSFWSMILFTGYVTFDDVQIDELTYEKIYSLKIPNLEVRSFFRKTFIEINGSGNSLMYSRMMSDLYMGKLEDFIKAFKKIYFNAVSYHDRGETEKYYHHFMLGLLLILGDKYMITSNRESGYGRYDIALEPYNKKDYGLIFEFKISEGTNLEEKAKEALEQIRKQKYETFMKNNGTEKIIKIGMSFSGKEVEIEYEIDLEEGNV